MTFEGRVELIQRVGVGNIFIVDGLPHRLVKFDEAARLYDFVTLSGRKWSVSDEAFAKGVSSFAAAANTPND